MLHEAAGRAKQELSTVVVLLREKDLLEAHRDLRFLQGKINIVVAQLYQKHIRFVLYADIKPHFNWDDLSIAMPSFSDELVLVDHLVIADRYFNTNYADGAAREMLTRYDLQLA